MYIYVCMYVCIYIQPLFACRKELMLLLRLMIMISVMLQLGFCATRSQTLMIINFICLFAKRFHPCQSRAGCAPGLSPSSLPPPPPLPPVDGWMDEQLENHRHYITLHLRLYLHQIYPAHAGKHCRTRCFSLRPIGRICVTCNLLAWFPDLRGQGHPWGV